jgi:hypothetical protein
MSDGRNGKHQQKVIVAISKEGASQREVIGNWLTVYSPPATSGEGASEEETGDRLVTIVPASHFEKGTAATVNKGSWQYRVY